MNFKLDTSWLDDRRLSYVEYDEEGRYTAKYTISRHPNDSGTELAILHGPHARADMLAYVCKKHDIDPSKVKVRKQNLSPDNPYWDWYTVPYNWNVHHTKYRSIIGKHYLQEMDQRCAGYSNQDLKKLIKHRKTKQYATSNQLRNGDE